MPCCWLYAVPTKTRPPTRAFPSSTSSTARRPRHSSYLASKARSCDAIGAGLPRLSPGLNQRCATFSGFRPIHIAAANGHVQCLQRLLELEVDRDPRNEEGRGPLHCAAKTNKVECVKVLLDAGADVGAKTDEARGCSLLA